MRVWERNKRSRTMTEKIKCWNQQDKQWTQKKDTLFNKRKNSRKLRKKSLIKRNFICGAVLQDMVFNLQSHTILLFAASVLKYFLLYLKILFLFDIKDFCSQNVRSFSFPSQYSSRLLLCKWQNINYPPKSPY